MRHDRHPINRIRSRQQQAEDGVPALVVGNASPLLDAHHQCPRRTQDECLERIEHIFVVDRLLVTSGCQQRRLVHQVPQVRADQTWSGRRNFLQVDVGRQRHATRMDPQDHLSTGLIRRLHCHPAVESTGSQESVVENVGPVGRGEYDHALT